jgi:hypothetical protein
MPLARRLLIAWLLSAGLAQAQVGFDAPPAITVYPNDVPVAATFFFPSGSPLERYTGRPGAWYAIYRLPLYPGRPYELLLGHEGDPARMKVYALDEHPFAKVKVKFEIPLHRLEVGARLPPTYAATIATPRDAAAFGIYLLLEWDPPAGKDKPIPVILRTLAVPDSLYSTPSWWFLPRHGLESPLQSQHRAPLEVPLPHRASGS